jgi:hypothetical protein
VEIAFVMLITFSTRLPTDVISVQDQEDLFIMVNASYVQITTFGTHLSTNVSVYLDMHLIMEYVLTPVPMESLSVEFAQTVQSTASCKETHVIVTLDLFKINSEFVL